MSFLRAARSLATPLTRRSAPIATFQRPLSSAPPADAKDAEWMTGRQLEELELQLAGVSGFNDQPASGPFGTIQAPVKIYSSFHSRIVGCKGSDEFKHRQMWFECKAGPKHVCTECGQVFQLVTPHTHGVKADAAQH